MIDQSHIDLMQYIPAAHSFKRAGGEMHGPCPLCRDGKDRFVVFIGERPMRWWCRVCGAGGDPVKFIQQIDGVDFRAAAARLGISIDGNPPAPRPAQQRRPAPPAPLVNAGEERDAAWQSPAWQNGAAALASEAHKALIKAWGQCNASTYLESRGIDRETAQFHGLGMLVQERRETWGETSVYAPRGISIPWEDNWGELRNVRVRRPAADIGDRGDKYLSLKGCGNTLYIARPILINEPVIMVEGEFDAIVVEKMTRQAKQWYGVVSIGSCTGARLLTVVARLALASQIMLAFDADDAGDKAAEWWSMPLRGKTSRIRPERAKDASEMHQNGYLQHWLIKYGVS